ncbi:MAG: T9SS type B sorting domain-containing protein, partial [Flavobacterium sp.]|nr:T9SS type B sorting domain-containing protein [Flavobacterium sp.]
LGLLGSGAKTDVVFTPGQAFDRVKVTISSLVQLNATKTVKIFDVYRSPAKPSVTAGNLAITACGGQTVNLTASTASTNELVWFNSLTGTTPLAVTAYNVPYVLNNVTASATYYVATRQIGCARLSERVPIQLTVHPLPTASDITINANINASCMGVAVLAPTTSLTGGVFKYYTDQNKTQEITSGFSGHPGLTYIKNDALGTLAISGLNASNTPRNYYIAIEVAGLCENAINTLAAVQVGLGAETPLTVLASISGCGFVNLRDAITNFDTSGATTYTFYDSSNNPITAAVAANITTSGTYYIEAFNPADACASVRKPVVVTVNPLPTLQVNPTTYTVNLGGTVTLQSTSNAAVTWYNQSGTALGSNVAGPFTTAGYYTFTAVANNGLCSVSLSVTVNVIDPANCQVFLDRVYADTQTSGSIITGGVTNGPLAIDHNPQTFSTITTGLGLLGIGTTWQNIQWNTTIPAGTPVTVKVGSEFSGLALLGAVTVIGTKRDGLGNPIDIGTLQQLSGTLLNLLPGENNFEYTFVPSNSTGPKAYDGIRIQIGSVLSVAQSARIYEAYYHKVADPVVCQPGDVEDVFYGNIDLGIGALTSTVGVTNAWNAVDNNHATFATMTTGVGVLAASELTVKFRSISQENDVVKVRMSRPSTVLNLGLIAGFSIQRYMGNNPVGSELDGSSNLLTLQLLNGGTEAVLITNATSPAFDRVRIRFGGAASVLNALQIHSVTREAGIDVVGSGGDRIIEVCYGDEVKIAPIDCTTFNWYDAPTGGNLVTSGTSYTIPYSLTVGSHNFYLQPVRSGCEVMERTQITITVRATSPQASLTGIQINSGNATTICSPTGAVTLTAQLNSTPAVTNPIYYWYSFDGTNQTLIAGQSTATLALTGLAPGTYTYYVGVSSDQFCATLPAERRSVTFTILPASTAADITVSDVQHCLVNPAPITIQPTSTLTNPVFTWYFTNDINQPITNGTVNGVTYSIAANGTLTVTGLTTANSPYTYYVAVTSNTTCQNLPGTLQDVVIQINDTATPTTNNMTQNFCKSTNPTIASIQVNEAGVIWYNAPTGGTVVASTTPLTTGTYYGVLVDGTSGCESSIRLAVAVQVNDAPTPTTNNATQNFCQSTNPTVASIQVNETGVIWYNAPTGGTVVASTTPLTTGTYYGVLVDATSGCESSIRLAVAVQVNDAPTPTTNNATQNFCQSTNPTVASIQVNQTGVIWYNAATGGTVVASTTPLTTGTYYGVLVDPTSGCESSVRLAVAVQINDAPTPTTNNATQNFCQTANPTVASIQVNETGVIWYNAPTGGTAVASNTPLTAGTYYGVLVDPVTGCQSSIRLAVVVQFFNGTQATITGGSPTACIQDQVTYTTNTGMSNYVWVVSSGGQIVNGGTTTDNTITVLWTQIGANTVSVSYNDANGCSTSNSAAMNLNVTNCSDITITKSVDNPTPFIDDNVVFTITVTNTGQAQFQNIIVNEAIPNGYAFVSMVVSNGTYNNNTGIWTIPTLNANQVATLQLTVKVLFSGDYLNTATITSSDPVDVDVNNNTASASVEPKCLVVYNEFTPNDDGANDVFTIKCAEHFPNNSLEIFNRYGNLVYKTRYYQNDWKGISNVNGTFDGSVLPTGTYYYVFDTGDNTGTV